jgi:HEAT repeat protein
MRFFNHRSATTSRSLILGGLAIAICWISTARGDSFPVDPVESLRKVLKIPLQILSAEDADLSERLSRTEKPEERDKIQAEILKRNLARLNRKLEAIHEIGDMRRAILLQEWPQQDIGATDETETAKLSAREQLVRRFQDEIRRILKEGNATARLAAMNMLADLGSTLLTPEQASPVKGSPVKRLRQLRGPGGGLAPNLADQVLHGQTRDDRLAAAYALGLIFPPVEVAAPALGTLLNSRDVAERRAAAGGLASIVRVVADLTARGKGVSAAELDRNDVANADTAIAPYATRGLSDSDTQVRRLCAEALGSIATALNSVVPLPPTEELGDVEADRKELEQAQKELMPLLRELKEPAKALGNTVGDPDSEVRLRSRRALEEMATLRQRIMRSPGGSDAGSPNSYRQGVNQSDHSGKVVLVAVADQAKSPVDDPLLEGLLAGLPNLSRAVRDPLVQNRLAALEVIETLGPSAAPAVPAVMEALGDRDLFVRWAAARTLGKVGPVRPAVEVPALARLLSDPDVDVNKAAAVALERYGPQAIAAVGALVRMLRADHWVLRIQAIQSLESIGTGAVSAIPALAAAMSDPDIRVRRGSADLLGKFGPQAKEAIPALRQALGDSKPDVRKAAGDALLSITAGK